MFLRAWSRPCPGTWRRAANNCSLLLQKSRSSSKIYSKRAPYWISSSRSSRTTSWRSSRSRSWNSHWKRSTNLTSSALPRSIWWATGPRKWKPSFSLFSEADANRSKLNFRRSASWYNIAGTSPRLSSNPKKPRTLARSSSSSACWCASWATSATDKIHRKSSTEMGR